MSKPFWSLILIRNNISEKRTMKLVPSVRNFLCCFKLETGGLVLGWISVICGGLAVLLLGLFIILAIISIIYFDDVITDTNNINSNVSDEDLKLVLISEFKQIDLFANRHLIKNLFSSCNCHLFHCYGVPNYQLYRCFTAYPWN